ncbi:MAG TPA: hypothetical protein VE476_09300, partial [Propionibacteriaceae bacterium]|nr:hypothetical protein [Propionibacteriaceae bacterium]
PGCGGDAATELVPRELHADGVGRGDRGRSATRLVSIHASGGTLLRLPTGSAGVASAKVVYVRPGVGRGVVV